MWLVLQLHINRMNPHFIYQSGNQILRLKGGEIPTLLDIWEASITLHVESVSIDICDQVQYALIIYTKNFL